MVGTYDTLFVFWYKIGLDQQCGNKGGKQHEVYAKYRYRYLVISFFDPVPHNRRPPGSGSAWTDAGPDPVGDKLRNKTENCRY